MIITINFTNEELAPALQQHLDNGIAMQTYVKAALRFYNFMLAKEKDGNAIGFGEKNRFKQYNNEISPKNYLEDS